ncbi:MAG: hypothetical protein K6F59_02130 [Gammaproteobacteria bacterium]|nr:hypothetical protein [Gammaproteobacteria bacterium]
MKKRILSLLVLLLSAVILVGCTKTTKAGNTTTTKKNNQSSNTEVKKLVYADGTELKLAVGHNNASTTITFADAKIVGEGLTLADGNTYHVNDLKPVWAELQNRLKVKFTNVFGNQEVKNEYAAWKNLEFQGVDVVVGNASDMAADGKLGKIVDLSQWLDYMPNFKKFLEDNPIVYLSVVSDVKTGAIYYAPYFDGYDDIEKYFLMRIDWVEKLLDGEGAFTATESDTVATIFGTTLGTYTPYMPETGTIALESLSADGKSTQTITKNFGTTYGNIAKYMNEHLTATSTGVDAVNMLRNYIDAAYTGVYGTKRSQLFTGYNACWDVDELVALLRCVKLNTFALTGQNTNKVTAIYPREYLLNRTSDLLSFTQLFGARGYESRNDYLYFNAKGDLVDARQDETLTAAVGKLNQLYKEGLILADFDTDVTSGVAVNKYMAQNNLGFMMYDYLQTQCIYNNDSNTTTKAPDYNFTAVMTPVAKYQDGTEGGVYMRFTESWRSVKTNGWCIPATCTGEKLQAALALFDYMYSKEGNVLMSFGPSAWQTGKTITYKGEQVPELNEACLNELWTKAGGNYTNYARQYLGSTLPVGFVKNQGMEYQCTTEKGKAGGEKVSVAIAAGVIKHVSPEIKENLFYTMVPTVLPTTKEQDTLLANYAALEKLYSKQKNKYNIYIEVIKNGFGSGVALNNTFITTMPADAASLVTEFKKNQGGAAYTLVKIQAWNSLLEFYKNR